MRYDHESLGRRRRALHLTPEQLGENVGRAASTIRRYERGTLTPTVYGLADLAEALGWTVAEFFTDAAPTDPVAALRASLDTLPGFTAEQRASLRTLLPGGAR